MGTNQANIRDVARKAKVSVSTVSRALNNYKDVNKETRERIIRVVKELNYHPNSIAQGLVRQKTNILGFVLSYSSDTILLDLCMLEIFQGMMARIDSGHYNLCLLGQGLNLESEDARLKLITQKLVDGVIIHATEPNLKIIEDLEKLDIPFVVSGQFGTDVAKKWYSVSSDDFGGAFKATSYLISLGHSRIGFIGQNSYRMAGSLERLDGYKKALEAKLIAFENELVVNGDYTMESGFQGTLQLFKNQQPPSAIFAANDQMAIGAMKAARILGLKVPEQLSIIGFDDMATSSFIFPSLTTIRQQNYEIGSLSVKMLIDLLNNQEPETKQIILPTSLVERDSCCIYRP